MMKTIFPIKDKGNFLKKEKKMKSCEATGKTIEKAIENALLELNASREDVDIKILEEGGLFKKAKVLVTISDDCSEKYNKKQVEISDDEDLELDVKSMFKDILSLFRKNNEAE